MVLPYTPQKKDSIPVEHGGKSILEITCTYNGHTTNTISNLEYINYKLDNELL